MIRQNTKDLIDESYEFDYLPKDRPYNELRYKKFIGRSRRVLIKPVTNAK